MPECRQKSFSRGLPQIEPLLIHVQRWRPVTVWSSSIPHCIGPVCFCSPCVPTKCGPCTQLQKTKCAAAAAGAAVHDRAARGLEMPERLCAVNLECGARRDQARCQSPSGSRTSRSRWAAESEQSGFSAGLRVKLVLETGETEENGGVDEARGRADILSFDSGEIDLPWSLDEENFKLLILHISQFKVQITMTLMSIVTNPLLAFTPWDEWLYKWSWCLTNQSTRRSPAWLSSKSPLI